MTVPLTPAIARHVATARFEDLDTATVEMTKRSLLDALGVSLAASGAGEGVGAFVDLALHGGGPAQCAVLGFDAKAPLLAAALANGAMAHAMDYEDVYDGGPIHPNAPTIPAALAVAEAFGGVSGKDLIAALAVGCDLVCRIGMSLQARMDDFGFYPPSMLSAFGATAAAGRLLRLDERQMVDAFSLTLCQAVCSGELKYTPDSQVRGVRDAFAAQAGVLSAQLAQRGVRGFDMPFEGRSGLFQMYVRGAYDPAVVLDGLGRDFYGKRISLKRWPACRGTHAFIEAALKLVAEHALTPDLIAGMTMTGGVAQKQLHEPMSQKAAPQTAIDAKFSLPFTVATAIVHGAVRLDHFTAEALQNPRVQALGSRSAFVLAENADPVKAVTSGHLEIRTTDGRTLAMGIEFPYGNPANPIPHADLAAKFFECAGYAARPWPQARLEALVAAVDRLEMADDLQSGLFSLLS